MSLDKLNVEVKDLSNKTEAENQKIEADFQRWYDKKVQLAKSYTNKPEEEQARQELNQYNRDLASLEKRYEKEKLSVFDAAGFQLQPLGTDVRNTVPNLKNMINNATKTPEQRDKERDQDILNKITPLQAKEGYESVAINRLISQVSGHSEIKKLMRQQNYNNRRDQKWGTDTDPSKLLIAQKALELYAQSLSNQTETIKKKAGYTDISLKQDINKQQQDIKELQTLMNTPEMKDIKARQEKATLINTNIKAIQEKTLGLGNEEYYKQKQLQLQQAQERISKIAGGEEIIKHKDIVDTYAQNPPTDSKQFQEYLTSIQSIATYQQSIQRQMSGPDGVIFKQYAQYSQGVNALLKQYGGQSAVQQLFTQVQQDKQYVNTRADIRHIQKNIKNQKLATYQQLVNTTNIMLKDVGIIAKALNKPEDIFPGVRKQKELQQQQEIQGKIALEAMSGGNSAKKFAISAARGAREGLVGLGSNIAKTGRAGASLIEGGWNRTVGSMLGLQFGPDDLEVEYQMDLIGKVGDAVSLKKYQPSSFSKPLFDDNRNMNRESLAPKLGSQVVNMIGLLKIAKILTPVMGATGGLMGSGMILQSGATYEKALKNGLTGGDAMGFALLSTGATSALELINPNLGVFGGEMLKSFSKEGLVGLKTLITKNLAKEIGGEITQEFLQTTAEKGFEILSNKLQGATFDVKWTLQEFAEIALLTGLTTGLVSSKSIIQGSKQEHLIQQQLKKIQSMQSFKGKTEAEIKAILGELGVEKNIIDNLGKDQNNRTKEVKNIDQPVDTKIGAGNAAASKESDERGLEENNQIETTTQQGSLSALNAQFQDKGVTFSTTTDGNNTLLINNKSVKDYLQDKTISPALRVEIKNKLLELQHLSKEKADAYTNKTETDPEVIKANAANRGDVKTIQDYKRLPPEAQKALQDKILTALTSSNHIPDSVTTIIKGTDQGPKDALRSALLQAHVSAGDLFALTPQEIRNKRMILEEQLVSIIPDQKERSAIARALIEGGWCGWCGWKNIIGIVKDVIGLGPKIRKVKQDQNTKSERNIVIRKKPTYQNDNQNNPEKTRIIISKPKQINDVENTGTLDHTEKNGFVFQGKENETTVLQKEQTIQTDVREENIPQQHQQPDRKFLEKISAEKINQLKEICCVGVPDLMKEYYRQMKKNGGMVDNMIIPNTPALMKTKIKKDGQIYEVNMLSMHGMSKNGVRVAEKALYNDGTNIPIKDIYNYYYSLGYPIHYMQVCSAGLQNEKQNFIRDETMYYTGILVNNLGTDSKDYILNNANSNLNQKNEKAYEKRPKGIDIKIDNTDSQLKKTKEQPALDTPTRTQFQKYESLLRTLFINNKDGKPTQAYHLAKAVLSLGKSSFTVQDMLLYVSHLDNNNNIGLQTKENALKIIDEKIQQQQEKMKSNPNNLLDKIALEKLEKTKQTIENNYESMQQESLTLMMYQLQKAGMIQKNGSIYTFDPSFVQQINNTPDINSTEAITIQGQSYSFSNDPAKGLLINNQSAKEFFANTKISQEIRNQVKYHLQQYVDKRIGYQQEQQNITQVDAAIDTEFTQPSLNDIYQGLTSALTPLGIPSTNQQTGSQLFQLNRGEYKTNNINKGLLYNMADDRFQSIIQDACKKHGMKFANNNMGTISISHQNQTITITNETTIENIARILRLCQGIGVNATDNKSQIEIATRMGNGKEGIVQLLQSYNVSADIVGPLNIAIARKFGIDKTVPVLNKDTKSSDTIPLGQQQEQKETTTDYPQLPSNILDPMNKAYKLIRSCISGQEGYDEYKSSQKMNIMIEKMKFAVMKTGKLHDPTESSISRYSNPQNTFEGALQDGFIYPCTYITKSQGIINKYLYQINGKIYVGTTQGNNTDIKLNDTSNPQFETAKAALDSIFAEYQTLKTSNQIDTSKNGSFMMSNFLVQVRPPVETKQPSSNNPTNLTDLPILGAEGQSSVFDSVQKTAFLAKYLFDGNIKDKNKQNAELFAQLNTPDQQQAEQQRTIQAAEKELSISLTPAQKQAVMDAHLIGYGEKGPNGDRAGLNNYTQEQVARKYALLMNEGLSRAQAKMLLEKGVCGFYDFVNVFDKKMNEIVSDYSIENIIYRAFPEVHSQNHCKIYKIIRNNFENCKNNQLTIQFKESIKNLIEKLHKTDDSSLTENEVFLKKIEIDKYYNPQFVWRNEDYNTKSISYKIKQNINKTMNAFKQKIEPLFVDKKKITDNNYEFAKYYQTNNYKLDITNEIHKEINDLVTSINSNRPINEYNDSENIKNTQKTVKLIIMNKYFDKINIEKNSNIEKTFEQKTLPIISDFEDIARKGTVLSKNFASKNNVYYATTPQEKFLESIYVSGYDRDLNMHLRGLDEKITTQDNDYIKALDGIINKIDILMNKNAVLEDNIIVTRRLFGDGGIYGEMEKGGEITEKGYISTSLGESSYGPDSPFLMKIIVPKGTHFLRTSINPTENEVLLPRGLTMQLKEIDKDGTRIFEIINKITATRTHNPLDK